jgi:uncharacterized protein YndB with AHSA1/START domain
MSAPESTVGKVDAIDKSDQRGRLVGTPELRLLRFTRVLPAVRAHVWSAITEPDQMARWAFRGELEPRAGGALRFDFGEGGSVDGTVLAWEAPDTLEYEWPAGAEEPWQVRFLLSEADDGATLLTFEHLRPDPASPDVAAGWHWHLDRLATLLAGAEPAAVDSDAHFEELQASYRAERT